MSSLRIRSCLARTALAIWLVSSLGIGLAAPPAGFDERVESLCTTVGLPGISIAIVENGNVTHANGYGVRRLGAADRSLRLRADGKVERITMTAVSPAADFNWDYHDLLFTPAAGAR